ncbi:MAG: hypothetical protein KBA51_04115 [Kiritimatiellae bacterium]|nr:hypothetical protein [Kiritimatiellia bacterium]
MKLSRDRAWTLLRAFPSRRVTVVGDLMLDRYVQGSVERISPEAPVPVVHVRERRAVPGGASNVAMNLRALGGRASVCGLLGKDASGEELEARLRAAGVMCSGARRPNWPTIVKTRVLADRQQIARVDDEAPIQWKPGELNAFAARAARAAAAADAVVLEDYDKGVVNQRVASAVLRAARRAGIPSGLDPKNHETLRIRGVTFATPNRKEAFETAGIRDPGALPDPLRDPALLRVGRALLEQWAPRHLAITLGSLGMLLLSPGERPRHVPTRAIEVFDVSGAGDTVIAALALALAAGANFIEASELANYAAGVVVGKLGTATCSPEELVEHMRECGAP